MDSPTLTPLGHDIFLIHDLLDPPTCAQIIQVADASRYESAQILRQTVDRETRHTDIIPLNRQDPLAHSTNQLILGRVAIAQTLLRQEYGIRFPYAEPCSILRYSPGQFYKRHVDNILLASRFQEVEQGIPTRDVSIVGYLNEGFEGGETYFDRQEITVTPRAGAVLVFPAWFTHPHQSLPVRSGVKYAFTSWLYH
ncbi:MAG: 2OG-Fe(II) oxygenase [Synechococcales bacterium]|nr:2OG-Fe(II) oxygenase [Synechococcales bacterium]